MKLYGCCLIFFLFISITNEHKVNDLVTKESSMVYSNNSNIKQGNEEQKIDNSREGKEINLISSDNSGLKETKPSQAIALNKQSTLHSKHETSSLHQSDVKTQGDPIPIEKEYLIAMKQKKTENSIEIDDDTFGYGYAVIVFFVVLSITVLGIQTLISGKKNKEGLSPDNCGEYILFEPKDQETEVETVI